MATQSLLKFGFSKTIKQEAATQEAGGTQEAATEETGTHDAGNVSQSHSYCESRRPNPTAVTVSKDKRYDTEKRQRVFQPHWKDSWPWLVLKESQGEEKMFCEICLKYPTIAMSHSGSGRNAFVSGCDKFRIEPIKAHGTSKAHMACSSWFKQEKNKTPEASAFTSSTSSAVKSAQPIIVKALQKLKEGERKRLTILFNNAYLIAKQGKPLSDMDMLCRAMVKAGVDLGKNYTNREKAAEFIKCEAEIIRQDIKEIVRNSRFICIVADGSTDSAIIEQETVLIRVVHEGKPYTAFVDLVPVEHAHATGVLDAIVKGLKNLSLDMQHMRSPEQPGPTLISVNFDGAAVMLGSKGGVAALIKKDIPFLLPVHCVAHKLQLAILDVGKNTPYLLCFEETLKWVFKFYWNSPKRRRDAKEIARVIEESFAHFSDIKQVRWVSSKRRALKAMQQNLQTVVLHLGQVGAGTDESSAKARKYLKSISSVNFLSTLCILRDILEPVSQLSEFFQSNDLLLLDVKPALEKCALRLTGLRLDLGENMKLFNRLYHPEERKFGDQSTEGWEIQLTGQCPPATSIRNVQLIENIIDYIDERFSIFNSMPSSGFQVFDYSTWPEGREELYTYGRDDLEELLGYFGILFSAEEKSAILDEFCGLKAHMKNFKDKNIKVLPAYSSVLSSKPSSLCNILKVVEMMFTVSVSTAEAERVFSAMNIVKNPLRTKLKQGILQDLMIIKMEGPEFEEYDPSRAIQYWLTSGGTKHVGGHKRPHEVDSA